MIPPCPSLDTRGHRAVDWVVPNVVHGTRGAPIFLLPPGRVVENVIIALRRFLDAERDGALVSTARIHIVHLVDANTAASEPGAVRHPSTFCRVRSIQCFA